jgi:hypothetical protein
MVLRNGMQYERTKEVPIEGEVSAGILPPLKERLIPCDVGRAARCSTEI